MRRSYELVESSYSLTDIGRVRSHNEDSAGIIVRPGFTLLCVFDGMGGRRKGEVASTIALETFLRTFEPLQDPEISKTRGERLVRQALKEANSLIVERAENDGQTGGMGTTAVVALVLKEVTVVANMGDSRCYTMKRDRVTLKQVTEDQSYVQMLVKKGAITKKQAMVHPSRNIITNALGIKERCTSKVQVIPNDYEWLLLCSDGLYTMVSEPVMSRLIRKDTSVENRVISLINTANDMGGKDNISACLYERRLR